MNHFDELMRQKANDAQDPVAGASAGDPNPGEWLPLPPILGRTFRWALEAPGWAPPLPVAMLCEADTVGRLDKRLRHAYEEAVRRKLREPLAHEDLPHMLLESPVRAGAVGEVRAHLSRNGRPRAEQPDVLTIADALPFIGRRPNRLLQCVDRGVAVPLVSRSHEHEETVFLNEKLLRAPKSGVAVMVPKAKISKNPFSLTHPVKPPSRWGKLRAAASDVVSVLLSDGALLTARDPRFGWALLRIHGMLPLQGQALDEIGESVHKSAVEGLIQTYVWLRDSLEEARSMSTAEETSALIQALLPRDTAKHPAALILAGRYGLQGNDLTLEECGAAFEMTRERVRQLQAAFESKFSEDAVYAPALRRFANSLEKTELCALGRLPSEISAHVGPQTARGAIAAARAILGRPAGGWFFNGVIYPPYGLTIACWSTRLAQPDILCILRSARGMIARVGAFHVTSVLGDVSEELRAFISRSEVEAVIDSCDQFCWIDRESGWGTLLGAGDAPVFTEVRKMLGVAYPISLDIADIFAGLAACRRQVMNRDTATRFGGGMPPPWVVRKLLEIQPDLQLAQYDNFKLKKAVDPLGLIDGENEKEIYRTLLKFGGVASWQELRKALVDTRVMNPVSFGVVLKSSSIFCQPAFGLYALRGWRINVEQVHVRGVQRSFSKPASQARYSLAHEDALVFECDVNQTAATKGHRSKRLVYVPSAVAQRVLGTFVHAETPDRRIRIGKHGQVARLANELSDHGVLPRETIRLILDTVARTYSWSRPIGERQ